MIKYIDHFWASGGVVEFNTRSGSIRNASGYEWQKAPDWGTAWQQKGRWYILHNDSTSFILQTESQQWRLTPELELSLRKLLFYKQFRISRGGKSIFSLWYIPRYFYMALLDPAHDAEEEETDDFFLHIVNFWSRWKNREYSEFLKIMAENQAR